MGEGHWSNRIGRKGFSAYFELGDCMSRQYYLSKNGNHSGPYGSDEVLRKLESREFNWLDCAYDDDKEDWVALMNHSEFKHKFEAGFASPVIKPDIKDIHSVGNPLRNKEWFIFKAPDKYQVYSYLEIIQMLQEKTLLRHDYVWHQNFSSWKYLSEVPEFAAEKIRDLKDSTNSEIADIFYIRKHKRVKYDCSLIIHNNKSVFKGSTLEISAGGAGVKIDTQLLQPGQTIFLHFQSGEEGVPPFNAICSIVSKQFVKAPQGDGVHIKYGLQFTSISQSIRDNIKNFAEAQKLAA